MQDEGQHDADPLPRVRATLIAGRERGLHEAAQVHVRTPAGQRLDAVIGHTAAGAPVDPDSVFSWTCATKPILAIGLGRLVDRGQLAWADDVRRWIPEAPSRWGPLTLTHLLTHTVGWVDDPGAVAALVDWDDALDHVLTHGEVAWSAGERAAYSVWTGWLLLGEVLGRATGESIPGWLEAEVLRPAGMRRTTLAGSAPQGNQVSLQHRAGDPHPYLFDQPEHHERFWPGLSGRGPASDLVTLFEGLLLDGLGEGPGLLTSETARQIATPVRTGIVDEASGMDHAWGLGLTVDRRAVHPRAPEGTFCHAGIASSAMVIADPRRRLVAAYTTDGITSGLSAMARRFGINQAVYADVTSGRRRGAERTQRARTG